MSEVTITLSLNLFIEIFIKNIFSFGTQKTIILMLGLDKFM